jgi:hypothetical protein
VLDGLGAPALYFISGKRGIKFLFLWIPSPSTDSLSRFTPNAVKTSLNIIPR